MLAETHNGVWGGCWCTWFHPASPEKRQSPAGQQKPEAPAGRGRPGARRPGLRRRRSGGVVRVRHAGGAAEHLSPGAVREGAGPDCDYRLTCFFIDRNHRRQGVSAAALRGALDLIAQAGCGMVEGYPRDNPGQEDLGVLPLERHPRPVREGGFEFVRSKGKYNCVMRTTVEPA